MSRQNFSLKLKQQKSQEIALHRASCLLHAEQRLLFLDMTLVWSQGICLTDLSKEMGLLDF